jgi:hypothetical protein
MSDPKPEQVLGPNSIGTDIRIIEGPGNTTPRPMSEFIAELREQARKRREQQQAPPPPKENGETGTP